MWEVRPEGPFKGNICYVFHTATLSPSIPFAEAEANARAIAMLPELVEAVEFSLRSGEAWLQDVIDQEGDCADHSPDYCAAKAFRDQMKAAISKLKGQP